MRVFIETEIRSSRLEPLNLDHAVLGPLFESGEKLQLECPEAISFVALHVQAEQGHGRRGVTLPTVAIELCMPCILPRPAWLLVGNQGS